MLESLPTPSVIIDIDLLRGNIARMQSHCDAHGVALWPHIKTHKMLEVARMQLEAGARGLVCAKLSEAEAMLPSGVSSMFVAHSLVDPLQGPRLCRLADSLDTLLVACTSARHAEALERLLASVDLTLPVMMAVDTGLGREGARGIESAVALAEIIRAQPHMELYGIYTHEGQAYLSPPDERGILERDVYGMLMEIAGRLGPGLEVWPGCSVTAGWMAGQKGVTGVRPGTYVFGDLNLSVVSGAMARNDLAASVLATIVDTPTEELALIDAGSKTLSGDKTKFGICASARDGRDIHVVRCNEEHGYTTGSEIGTVQIGDRIALIPAHVCPVINLFDEVVVTRKGDIIDRWRVAARGCVQ